MSIYRPARYAPVTCSRSSRSGSVDVDAAIGGANLVGPLIFAAPWLHLSRPSQLPIQNSQMAMAVDGKSRHY